MKTAAAILLVILMGTSFYAADPEESPTSEAGQRGAVTGSAMPEEENLEAEEDRAATGCEHSKLATQDADPLGKGALQLQFNVGYNRSTQQWDHAWGVGRREPSHQKGGQLVLTWGVSEVLDLAAGSGYSWVADGETGHQPGRGVTDLALSAKWRFFENEARGIAFAFVPTLTIPTGKRTSSEHLGPSQEFWSLDTRVALVKDWPDRWTSNLDAGYVAVSGDRGDSRGSFSANVAVGYQLSSKFQPQVELNYSHGFVHGGQDADLIAVTAGVHVLFSHGVCLRAGVQHGIAGRNADRTAAILLSIDWNF